MGYLDEQSTCKDDQAHVVLTAREYSSPSLSQVNDHFNYIKV